MSGTAMLILQWLRTDPHTGSYGDGFTHGYIFAMRDRLPAWEYAYLVNVNTARNMGISA
jgi:hypothetical protein